MIWFTFLGMIYGCWCFYGVSWVLMICWGFMILAGCLESPDDPMNAGLEQL